MKQKKYGRSYAKKMKRKKNGSGAVKIIVIILVVIALLAAGFWLLRKLINRSKAPDPARLQAGDTIPFGAWEQDNDPNDGAETIQWQVLDVQEGKALIVSVPVLECKPFHTAQEAVSWADSSLRSWLNSDFYDDAFTDAEKEKIQLSTIGNPGTYEGWDEAGRWDVSNDPSGLQTIPLRAEGAGDTQDRVFLLSIDEAKQYFPSESDRKAFLSEHGIETFIRYGLQQAQNGTDANEDDIRASYDSACERYGRGFCSWWLRSPGLPDGRAAAIDYNGAADQFMTVDAEDGGVRPAIWIEIG